MAHRKKNRRREQIKDAQLCAAVRETLSLALAQSPDELLLSLFVSDVVPAPDASRLAVHIEAPPEVDLEEAREALERLGGSLRAEVAASIQRRKTPALFFDVRPAEQGSREPM
jgi:ribosome-binding factor A